MTNATSTTTDRSDLVSRKEWTAFVVLLLPLLLVSMDVSVLFFAIPSIDRDLAPSATQQLWIFDVYGFALSGLLITMGSLGDRIGRRKLLLLGAAAFGTASVGAAYATSPEMLIAARALLGIGGATLMPSTMGLVRNMFRNEQQRSTAVGIWSGAMAGGIALGSVLSGVMLQHFWWGSVFLINVLTMVLLVVLVPVLVPEFKDPNPGGSTCGACRCRWAPCSPSSTASRRAPPTVSTRATPCSSPSACSSAGSSSAASASATMR